MRCRVVLFVIAVSTLLVFLSLADDWASPEPTSYHSRGFIFVAEIFPPNSRHNDRNKPVCYFYQTGDPGERWKLEARLKWKAELINAHMPFQALVSMGGQLVTLNDHGHVGFKNAVVIYDKRGRLIKSYELDQLIPTDDMNKFAHSVSSRWWNSKAKYYFMTEPARFYILLHWGKALLFSLNDGTFSYSVARRFSDLSNLKPFANEEAEIWATSLRFSSITDVLQTRRRDH